MKAHTVRKIGVAIALLAAVIGLIGSDKGDLNPMSALAIAVAAWAIIKAAETWPS